MTATPPSRDEVDVAVAIIAVGAAGSHDEYREAHACAVELFGPDVTAEAMQVIVRGEGPEVTR